MNQGGLFTRDYLTFGIQKTDEWKALDNRHVAAMLAQLKGLFEVFPIDDRTSEARTEADLIWKIIPELDWSQWVTQQAISAKGRENIPDGLMFADGEAKARADKRISYEKYEEGTCIVESKKWNRLLDRPGRSKDESEVPSSQMQTTGLFEGIAKGDNTIGLPPYNGGLFDEAETPILARIKLPDDIFTDIIDRLCRVDRDGMRRHPNCAGKTRAWADYLFGRVRVYEWHKTSKLRIEQKRNKHLHHSNLHGKRGKKLRPECQMKKQGFQRGSNVPV